MNREEAMGRVDFELSSAREDLRQMLESPDRMGEVLDSLGIDDLANVLTLLIMLFRQLDAKMWERFNEDPMATIRGARAVLAQTGERMRAFAHPETEDPS